ncbi:MAG: DUF2029 domain-containing protein [Nitrospira sp.]|nr:DUF2029 domain-containing protein [Nitrospira sp.]
MIPWIRAFMASPLVRRVVTLVLVIAAGIHGYIISFGRSFHFRDIDIHREIGRRFLSGEYLYANDYCYMYLPTTGIYFAPLLFFERNLSLVLRYAVAIGCLVMTIRLFQRMLGVETSARPAHRLWLGVGAGVLTLQFILNDLDDGGPHLILLGILTGGLYAIWVGRERLGAALVGLGIVLKITPALFVLLFAWKRQWRVATYTVLAVFFWILLPLPYMGAASWWDHHVEWTNNALLSVLDRQVEGRQENELQKANLSLRHTMLRYLVAYPMTHRLRQVDPEYRPVLDLPLPVANAIVGAAALGLLAFFAWTSKRSFDGPGDPTWAKDCAGTLMLALFLSPITWDQHLVWMIPAACIVVAVAARVTGRLSQVGYVMLGLYVVLTVVLNYEVVGSAKWEMLKSYHHLGIAMFILFGLLLRSHPSPKACQPSLGERFAQPSNVVGQN